MPSISELQDHFDVIDDTDKWLESYGSYSAVASRARLVTASGVYTGLQSQPLYSFPDGAAISCRVYADARNGATTSSYTAITISRPPNAAGTDISMVCDRMTGNLNVANRVGYTDGTQSAVAYSGTSMAFWRIRRSGSNLIAETAPESSAGVPGTWTARRTFAVPAWMTSATDLEVILECHRNNGTAGYSEFDYLNVGPVVATPGNGRFFMVF